MIQILIGTYITITILSFLLTKRKFNMLIRINTLFTLTWVIGGILNLVRFAGMYRASYDIHGYIITTLIIFNLVYMMLSRKLNDKVKIDSNSFYVPIRTIVCINLSSIIFMIPFLIKAIGIIRTHDFAYLRRFAFVASDEFTNIYEARIMVWVIAPIIFSSLIIVAIQIVSGNFNLLLSSIVLINVTIYTFTLGGKMLIVVTMLLILLMLIIRYIYIESHWKIRIKVYHIVIIGVAVLYLIATTSKRALSGLGVVENFLVYNYGGISYFDAILNSKEYTVLNQIPLNGRGVFGLVLTPLLYTIRHLYGKSLFGVVIFDSEYLTKLITTYFLPISDSYNFNSHPTALYIFWRDTNSVVGIIMGALFIVTLTIWIENYFYKKRNMLSISLLLFMFYVLFMTTQKYILFEIQSAMNIVFIILFATKILEPVEIKLSKIIKSV